VELGPQILLQAVIVALVIGFVGGVFPGWRAARQKPLAALSA
jgi:ABC-type antimicrobial peptide transport system permease subunit